MVLAGLRPEIIMDIVSRGIGFWCHQMFQEKMIHKAKALQIETHLNQIESSYETLIVKMKNDLQVENKNYESLKKLSDDQARRILELEDCLNKKNQEIRSLQMRFNMMKRETLSTALSQGITSPGHHLLERRKRLSPKYMDQQSMINCPESFSQQDNNHQTHQHQQHFHYKHEEPSTIKVVYAAKIPLLLQSLLFETFSISNRNTNRNVLVNRDPLINFVIHIFD
ncbi:E3 ubiquitin-protein ligase CCNB1IP1-like isoform X5 [Lycorma delicatula]